MKYAEYLLKAKSKKISDHFTLYDVCHSDVALAHNIDNIPTAQIIINATLLASKCLEPIGKHFNKPVIVNCIYRSPILNASKWINGATNSQHRFGQACDFTVQGADLKMVFAWCKANLNYDQLIYEGTWIHISYTNGKNRKQTFKLVNGAYIPS